MGGFRRFILSIVGALEVLFVIGMTVGFGLLGAIIPGIAGGGQWALVGFLLAGSVGLCLSAILVNISMCLAEIAANTWYLKNKDFD